MTPKNNRAPLLCYFKLFASFRSHWWIQAGVTVWKRLIWVKIDDFFQPCDLAIWRMTLKNNRTPVLCYFKLCALFRSHWWIQTGVTVRKRLIWVKIDDFYSRVTLKFDGWPWKTTGHLIKLYASFHHRLWIQTGITVRKRLSWVVTSVTLTLDVWPWPFGRTLFSLVITLENFIMILWEHSEKGVTDRQTDRRPDRRTEPFIKLLGRS